MNWLPFCRLCEDKRTYEHQKSTEGRFDIVINKKSGRRIRSVTGAKSSAFCDVISSFLGVKTFNQKPNFHHFSINNLLDRTHNMFPSFEPWLLFWFKLLLAPEIRDLKKRLAFLWFLSKVYDYYLHKRTILWFFELSKLFLY